MTAIGCVMLYSAAGGHIEVWAQKQLIAAVFSCMLALFIAFTPTTYVYSTSYYLYCICILLLLIAESMGHTAMGAQRWLKISGITIQPSELTKIGVTLALSRYFSQLSLDEILKVRYLCIPLCIIFIPVVIILKQPNLGTATIIILVSGTIFFAAGVKIWKFVVVVLSVICTIPFIWGSLHDYQKKRITTFLHPEDDLLGAGYNIMQSRIAIGSGGLYGKGLICGTQTQLSFLPEKQTDFIFTVLAEEFGFYGVALTLLLYFLLTAMMYMIALRCKVSYTKLVCVGIISMIFFHTFINIGMISGLMPAVGIPLPLFSYGRSNLITIFIGLGLVLNADVFRKNKSKS